MARVVIDTNIFVSALLNPNGAPREVLRLALKGEITPIFGASLFSEYEDVLARQDLFAQSPLDEVERAYLFNGILSLSEWVRIYYLWRPNLTDEGDNHIVELAVAGGAEAVITANLRDFASSELSFPGLKFLNAASFLEWRTQQ